MGRSVQGCHMGTWYVIDQRYRGCGEQEIDMGEIIVEERASPIKGWDGNEGV